MNKKLMIAIGVILVVLVGIITSNTKKSSQIVSSEIGPTASLQQEDNMSESQRELTVEGDEYKFLPSNLSFKKGEKVKLTFKNAGRFPHNLVIDELGVTTKTIPGGESDTTEFIVDKDGTFSFYCSVGNHKSLGMEGTLKVE